MRAFNYKALYKKLLTPEVVSFLAQIHEQKGRQNLFVEAHYHDGRPPKKAGAEQNHAAEPQRAGNRRLSGRADDHPREL